MFFARGLTALISSDMISIENSNIFEVLQTIEFILDLLHITTTEELQCILIST